MFENEQRGGKKKVKEDFDEDYFVESGEEDGNRSDRETDIKQK